MRWMEMSISIEGAKSLIMAKKVKMEGELIGDRHITLARLLMRSL